VDPKHLVQRSVEQGAVAAKLPPQLLLGLSLGKVSRRCTRALPLLLRTCRGAARSWKGGARRRSLSTVSRAPQRCAAIIPHHECPHRGLGGWHGQAHPLVPVGRWDVLVRDLHHRSVTDVDWGWRRWNRRRGARRGHGR
jgi:hypothetical protein